MPNQFIVPQFIDKEDRIIGPVTVRQFLICLVGSGVLFLEYKILTTLWFVLAALVTAAVFGTFGFVKINGQPFHYFFLNFLQSQIKPGLRVWNKNVSLQELQGFQKVVGLPSIEKKVGKPRPSVSHLREMALVVNTGGVYKPEDEEGTPY